MTGRKRLNVIAIDGPAAAGKTTVARALADRIGAIFLDTGLLYRAVTYAAIERGIPSSDGEALGKLASSLNIAIRPPSQDDGRPLDILLDDIDVTPRLREPRIDRAVSEVSAQSGVRAALLPVQRGVADRGPVVMVGRDIATVVFPDAGVKIYLDASLDERARRRHDELVAKGKPLPYDVVLADLAARDAYDSSRDVAPLRQDPEAAVVNTDGMSIDEVIAELTSIVRCRWQAGEP